MRLTAALLVISFFIPLACELGIALRLPKHSCSQTQPRPQEDTRLECCLPATLQQPMVIELRRQLDPGQVTTALLLPRIWRSFNSVAGDRSNSLIAERHSDFSPPRLYLRNASLLI